MTVELWLNLQSILSSTAAKAASQGSGILETVGRDEATWSISFPIRSSTLAIRRAIFVLSVVAMAPLSLIASLAIKQR